MNRLFVDQDLNPKAHIKLSKDQAKHLKVLRIQQGEQIEIVNGRGALAICRYFKQDELEVLSVEMGDKDEYESVLIQAMPESSHLDFLIEKGCEIGVTHFILFPAKRSKKQSLSDAKVERLQKILISAMKQSKQLFLPKLTILNSFDEIKPHLPKHLFLADPYGEQMVITPEEDCGFIVGPESGFTSEEIKSFIHNYGAKPVCFSTNVLRAETAAIIAAFLLNTKVHL